MRTALASAEAVYADENATEEQVQTAVSELEGALAALVAAAPSEDDGNTSAGSDNTASGSGNGQELDGKRVAGVTSDNTSGSSTAKTSTSATKTAVKTGDTVNTAATVAVMIAALAVIGLAATSIASRKKR